MAQPPAFLKPNLFERAFNFIFGLLVGMGLGLPHNYLLQVRGRKSGKTYSTPVNIIDCSGKRYLVAPRGRTQWVRNVEASGEVVLRRAWVRRRYRVRGLADAEKAEVVKAYLDRYALTVQRYFPVPVGSPIEAYTELLPQYPAFELVAL